MKEDFFDDDLWRNAIIIKQENCICGVSFSVIIHSYRLRMMLVEWELFGLGSVEHFLRIQISLSQITFMRQVRSQISIYGP